MEHEIAVTEDSRARPSVKYVIILAAGIGAILLFLLASAGADTGLFERKYRLLIQLNAGFVLFLMGMVGYLLWRLRRRLNAGVFGSRLALRLLLVFSLMAILPGALVYGVSVQFLSKSIESWFDVKVDRALEGGLNLGRTILDNLLEELRKKRGLPRLCWLTSPDHLWRRSIRSLTNQRCSKPRYSIRTAP